MKQGENTKVRTNLGSMAVDMDWVTTAVKVVDHYLDYFVVIQYHGVRVNTINSRIGCGVACGQRRHQGWNLLWDPSNIVESGTNKI
jgi:hypothetical protein